MADLYVEKIKFPGPSWVGLIIGIASLILLPFIIGLYSTSGYIIKCLLMVLLFYTGLTNKWLIKIFSFAPIAIIGGMCYSIYLIHEQVISATGRLLKFIEIKNPAISFILSYFLLLLIVLIASAIYYKLVEQPCMKRNWWRNLVMRK
jgi:peptidoglycan/LPS O-acetylase OafA/YrhL